MKKKSINYLETFLFPDIPFQPYPVYSISESGHIYNIKSIMYPNPKSKKKFTRNKQLGKRSTQAKLFDFLINIKFFENLVVIPEFPIVIQNSRRLPDQHGGFYYLDYYFPQLSLNIELDSTLHDSDKDSIRDMYLSNLGISTFRILNLDSTKSQKKDFIELIKTMKSIEPIEKFTPFNFLEDINNKHINKLNDIGLWIM